MLHVTDERVLLQHGIPRRPNANPAAPNAELVDEAGNKPNTDHRADLLVTIPNLNERCFLDVSIRSPASRTPNTMHIWQRSLARMKRRRTTKRTTSSRKRVQMYWDFCDGEYRIVRSMGGEVHSENCTAGISSGGTIF